MTSPAPWRPRNAVEHELAAAAGRDDRQAFFQTLVAATLYIPQQVSDPLAAAAGQANPDDFVTYIIGETTYLLAFTSIDALQAAVGEVANGYTESNFPELRAGLNPEVRLGINMGTPVDAWIDVESMARAAAGEIDVPTGAEMNELLQVMDPDNQEAVEHDVEVGLENYVEDYLDKVLSGDILVVVAAPVNLPPEGMPRDFPWQIDEVGGTRTIEVFTEAEYVPPGTRTVAMPFTRLVEGWPHIGVRLAINPGTPLAFALEAEAIEPFSRSAPPGP